MLKVAINGFGRIGRGIVRANLKNPRVQVVAINDLAPVADLAHLLKYDSVHGTLAEDVRVEGNNILVGKNTITVFSEKDPAKIPFSSVGAQMVMECTGIFTEKAKAMALINGSVKHIIISAPAKDEDGTFVVGVNDHLLDPTKHFVVSNGSCTTNCLAPVAKVINEKFGVRSGLMTTIHSYTLDQKILDATHKDLRRARAGAENMIPTSTGAAKAVGLVLPELKGKLTGFSVRVPTSNVSMVDVVFAVNKKTTVEEVNAALKEASLNGPLKGYLEYNELPLVSKDYNGNGASSTVDALSTLVIDDLVKVIAWYDNETGFSNRMLDLTKRFS